ncbi:MAG: 4-aminobutyrate--2-oxoglutarate transaminase [Planctomycetes bacterium]|nr:4-aminobutyrate--2-oxoglutarate transaminase [Planctomycetota bacterium]
MSKNEEITKRRLEACPKGIGVSCPFYADKAKNAELWDVEGNRYIDFAGGIGVLNVGHVHDKFQAAIKAQVEKITHSCHAIVPNELYISAAERLNKIVPVGGKAKTCFFTTGAEAVENAVKVARSKTGRPGVIAFNAAFHGRTNFTLGLTGKVAPYKLGFGPFPGDIYHVPFPNALHGVSVQDTLDALTDLFKTVIEPKNIAAIIYEPVQGEGGFNIAPAEFVTAMRKLADEHGIILIHDEVQSGFARTGTMFASEQYDAKPDLITMAKSMSGGFPISGLSGKAEIMDAPGPGGLGGTYPGSPLGLAAVHAVLDIIEEEKICDRSKKLGEKVMKRLEALKADLPSLREIRGLGSMVAAEFYKAGTNEPDADYVKKVQAKALEKKLIILTCGTYYNVIRFLYPLTIEDKIMDEALDILEAALKECK